MTIPLRIGLAGLGTVGAGVVKLLDANAALIARRAGRPIQVAAVAARNRRRERGVDIARFAWEDDAIALAGRPDVDCVVELVGGAGGPALSLARATLDAGKPLVTANKAMLAHHGLELAERAERANAALKFEAAVAGGIPVIKGLREGTAANRLSRVLGILNGTCNYILSRMEREGLGFAEVLSDAQRLGYAEADPTFDVEGTDAAHKLAILASLSFGTRLDFASVACAGITRIAAADIAHAATLGFRIRLVGQASMENGALMQRVRPCLVPLAHPLASCDGPLNAVVAEGDFVGRLFFQGSGAGEGPTASAVAADLIDIARGERGPAFAMPVASLEAAPAADAGALPERAYLSATVQDRPGVLAELAAHLARAGVSIESLIQRGPAAASAERGVFIAMTTHTAPARAAAAAAQAMAASQSLIAPPLVLPIIEG